MTASVPRAARTAVAALVALCALTACAAPSVAGAAGSGPDSQPSSAAVSAPAVSAAPSGYARTFVTFYAAYDNDPPGSTEIAYGNERHAQAGGTGTFDDPMTLATDPNEIPPGTVIYYPAVRKYFVMEDDCAECISDWQKSKRPHIDLWMSGGVDKRVLGCEESLTPDGLETIEVNPPGDRPVDPRPLYDPSGHCWTAAG